jgi:arylsulfatase A-like enzyme
MRPGDLIKALVIFLVPLSFVTPLTAASPKEAAPPRKPNIIFILADDLGYGELGCYGQTRIKTPNIDRLAREGMRFTQCYAGSTVCAPSRCVLMTGLHTGHARIRGNGTVPLRAQDLTIAELLKQAGYRTGAVGKWGLGLENSTGTPNKKGFDEWLGFLDQGQAHNYYPTQVWRNAHILLLETNRWGLKGQYVHDLFARAATNFVRMNKDQPFFLYLPFTIPHANNELKEKGMEVPDDEPYSNQGWPRPERNKAAMITRLDESVGRLMDTLKESRIDDNTIVFFSSDNVPHKEGCFDPQFFQSAVPWRGIKRDLYEGGIRVPMIVRWPGKIKAGVVSEQVWSFWDFLPTAADIAGIKPPEKIDGISILPTLLGKKQSAHEFLYWEFHEEGFKQAVRLADWKSVRLQPDKPLELYNLKNDPSEKKNVAEKNPALVKKIEKLLLEARTESEEWPVKNPQTNAKGTRR